MTPSALKKLIAVFLLAASTVGSAALIAPAFLASTTPSAAPTPEDQTQNNPAQNGNAFIEAIPLQTEGTSSAPDALAAPLPSDNLTENAARLFAQILLAKNPTGPSLGADGAPVVETPDVDALVEQFANDPAVAAQIAVDQLGDDISRKSIKRIISPPAQRDIVNYLEAFNRIFQANALDPDFVLLIEEGEPTPELVNASRVVVIQTRREIEKLAVPEPLVDFHLAMLRMLADWQDLSSINVDSNDPLKEMVTLQLRLQQSDPLTDNFQAEFQKLRFRVQTSGLEEENSLSFLRRLFGVEHARAELGDPVDESTELGGVSGAAGFGALSVPTFDTVTQAREVAKQTSNIRKSFWKKLKEWAIATLKDRLISTMIRQTITWIQGGGRPQFISDWKGFLRDAGNVAVGDFLYELNPRLCQSFGPLVAAFLQPVNLSARPVTCTLEQVVGNVEGFYRDFRNGGWVAYAIAIEPQNNFFGALHIATVLSNQKAAEEAEAARTDAIAGQGTRSTQRCVRPFDKYRRCLDDVLEQCSRAGPPNPDCIANGNAQCETARGQQGCEPGGWMNTTPGSIITSLTAQALGTPFQRLVNAQDFTALVNAIVNAITTRLISAGQRGLAGLTFPNDTCRGLTGAAYDRCAVERACRDAGLTGTRLQDCLGARPTAPNIPPTPTSTPTSTDACAQENCGSAPDGNCLCKAQDGITTDDFCFLGDVSDAQARVEEAFRNGATNTGLTDVPFGGCNASNAGRAQLCVRDAEAYKLAVKAEVEGANPNVTVFITDEVCVVGTCNKNTCTNPATSLCPDTSRNPPGYCIAPGQRTECTKIDSSFNTIRYNVPNGICPGNAQ